MLRMVLTAVVVVMFVSSPAGYGATKVTAATMDSLWSRLGTAKSAADSVRILYNIYDANTARKSTEAARKESEQVLGMLFETALHAGDTARAYEAIRNLVSTARYDIKFINKQQERISTLPPSTEKRETDTYLHLQRHVYATRDTTMSHEQRQKNFHKMTQQLDKIKTSDDLYDKLNFNFALMLYGANLIQPKQLSGYMSELRKLVEQTRAEGYPIKFLFYTTAPIIYDDNQEWEEAVAADRKMLQLLDNLEQEARQNNRDFISYDRERFVSNRRLLSNYEYLKGGEPEQIYDKLKQLIRDLPDDQITEMDHITVEAIWSMYKHDYKRALELLRGVLSSKRFRDKPKYIMMYINAAATLGAYEDLEKGQRLYIELIKKRAQDASDTEYNRMRVALDIDSLEAKEAKAAHEAEGAEMVVNKVTKQKNYTLIVAGLVVFILLLVIIAIMGRSNRRNRKIADELKRTNDKLTAERDSLKRTEAELVVARDRASQAIRQKTDFIHNMGNEIAEPVKAIAGFSQLIVDSIPEDKRKYLSGFMEIINANNIILQRIAGDIRDSAEMEGAVTNVTVSHFKPSKICNIVAESFRQRLNADQTLEVEPLEVRGTLPGNINRDDAGIDSDASRLEQILLNIVGNAVKFCDRGAITISPVIDYDTGMLTIAVTDQGPGIPEGMEERVFQRFEKLGEYQSGLGLGLYICRELAHLIGGEVTIDKGYRKGTRMLVTVPISLRTNAR